MGLLGTALGTAAGVMLGTITIERIDEHLSCPSNRAMFIAGDVDRLLDARLELMAARKEQEGTEGVADG